MNNFKRSQEKSTLSNNVLTFIGSIGTFLIFALILFVVYLPQLADPADQAVIEKRQTDADSIRAAGAAKLEGYEVLNKEAAIVRIPIEEAKEFTLKAYQ